MTLTKVNRHEVVKFLKVDGDFSVVGIGVSDMGTSYNPNVESEKWVINVGSTPELSGYEPSSSVPQKCYKGDPVFEHINELRRGLTIGDGAKSQVLDVDVWDDNKATLFDCIIAIDEYMSSEAEITYTLHYSGDPTLGTATLDQNGKATFTPDGSV